MQIKGNLLKPLQSLAFKFYSNIHYWELEKSPDFTTIFFLNLQLILS